MEYQKIVNFVDNAPSQTSKFRGKHWTKINSNSSSQIKLKILMLSQVYVIIVIHIYLLVKL